MKKMVMVMIFLFAIMSVPFTHAATYSLPADLLWVDTGIDLNGESITFSNAATFSNNARHPYEWTWGINYYKEYYNIPRVWTGPDGGSGAYYAGSPYEYAWGYGDPALDNDEWLASAEHGELIAYIGWESPWAGSYVKNASFDTTAIFEVGTATVTRIGTGHVWIGINDEFVNPIEAVGENSGWATVNITTQPVPEPATMLLLGLGLAGVAGFRRKMKK